MQFSLSLSLVAAALLAGTASASPTEIVARATTYGGTAYPYDTTQATPTDCSPYMTAERLADVLSYKYQITVSTDLWATLNKSNACLYTTSITPDGGRYANAGQIIGTSPGLTGNDIQVGDLTYGQLTASSGASSLPVHWYLVRD